MTYRQPAALSEDLWSSKFENVLYSAPRSNTVHDVRDIKRFPRQHCRPAMDEPVGNRLTGSSDCGCDRAKSLEKPLASSTACPCAVTGSAARAGAWTVPVRAPPNPSTMQNVGVVSSDTFEEVYPLYKRINKYTGLPQYFYSGASGGAGMIAICSGRERHLWNGDMIALPGKRGTWRVSLHAPY